MTWLYRELMAYRVRGDGRELPQNGRTLDVRTMIEAFCPGGLAQRDQLFDAATALAVTEHIPEEELATWAKWLGGMMAPGGVMVITVPAPTVDKILHLLIALRLIAGIEAHQHHGFQPQDLEKKI